jgi:hypothetical protein
MATSVGFTPNGPNLIHSKSNFDPTLTISVRGRASHAGLHLKWLFCKIYGQWHLRVYCRPNQRRGGVGYICRACGVVCSMLTGPLYLAVPVALLILVPVLIAPHLVALSLSLLLDGYCRKSSPRLVNLTRLPGYLGEVTWPVDLPYPAKGPVLHASWPRSTLNTDSGMFANDIHSPSPLATQRITS